MTGRLSAPLAVVSLVSSAILASGCVFVVDRGPDQDATFHYHSSHLNRRFEVWGAGQVTFAEDDRGVAHIAPGGFLHVEERRGFRTRRVRVAPEADGRVRLTHTVNGRDQPDDADAREELARIFLQAIRRTGIGAEARVGRLLAAGGVDRVFDDLAAFESSTAVSRYLTALLAQGALTTANLIETADQATTRIRSGGTRASFLIEAMPYFPYPRSRAGSGNGWSRVAVGPVPRLESDHGAGACRGGGQIRRSGGKRGQRCPASVLRDSRFHTVVRESSAGAAASARSRRARCVDRRRGVALGRRLESSSSWSVTGSAVDRPWCSMWS